MLVILIIDDMTSFKMRYDSHYIDNNQASSTLCTVSAVRGI